MTEAELEFREFFAAEYGRLRGLGYLLTSDWAEAEELAQDALVRTNRAWGWVRRHDRPSAYARKVLVNRHRSLLRRAKVEARHLAGRRVEETYLIGPVQLVTSVLEEFYNPAPNTWKDGTYEDGGDLSRAFTRRPEGRQSRGSFPGGQALVRTDLQAGRWRTTQWHIAWPYRCQPGVRCPALPGPSPAISITAPRCIDRSRPSRLMVEEILR